MKTLIALLVLVVVGGCGSREADLSGTWKGSIPGAQISFYSNISKADRPGSGEFRSINEVCGKNADGKEVCEHDGHVYDDWHLISWGLGYPDRTEVLATIGETLSCHGTISGNKLSGTCEYHEGSGHREVPWSAVKN
jgi:hypothetical protein